MRGIGVILSAAVAFLLPGCVPSEDALRSFVEMMAPVLSNLSERPTLRETPDGCAADLTMTNPDVQSLQVSLSYRAFDANGQELPELRVTGLVPGKVTMVLHGDITPGLACAQIEKIEARNGKLDFH